MAYTGKAGIHGSCAYGDATCSCARFAMAMRRPGLPDGDTVSGIPLLDAGQLQLRRFVLRVRRRDLVVFVTRR